MNSRHSLAAVAPLFLILFIDGMGLSLLFPVLNSIIIDVNSHFLSPTVSLATRDFLYGLVAGIFMISWFFGATILGDVSDFIGRKKALMICLIGAFLGYVLSAVAVTGDSLLFLILGRVVAGLTAGSQPIAQAAIVDVSLPEHKARNFGLIILSVSLGFIIGPIIGGFLSNHEWISWFNFATPLYFAALISLLNAFLLGFLFKETFIRTGKIKLQFHRALHLFASAFKQKRIRYLSIVLFVMTYGWANFFTFLSLYAVETFGFTPMKVSLLMTGLGVGFAIGGAWLVDYFVKRFSMKNIIAVSYSLAFLFVLIFVLIKTPTSLWMMITPIGMSVSVGYAVIMAIFSNQVGADEQGWVMGITGSISALCFGVTALMTGVLAKFSAQLPMLLSLAGFAVSVLLVFWIRQNNLVQSNQPH